MPWRRRCHLSSWTVSDALCKHVQRHNKVRSSSRPLTKIVLSSAYFFFTPAIYAGTGAGVLRRDSMLAPSLSLVYALEAVKAPTMYRSNIVTNRPLFFLIDTPIATHWSSLEKKHQQFDMGLCWDASKACGKRYSVGTFDCFRGSECGTKPSRQLPSSQRAFQPYLVFERHASSVTIL